MAEQSRELSTGKGQVDPSDSPHTPCPGVEEMDQWVNMKQSLDPQRLC